MSGVLRQNGGKHTEMEQQQQQTLTDILLSYCAGLIIRVLHSFSVVFDFNLFNCVSGIRSKAYRVHSPLAVSSFTVWVILLYCAGMHHNAALALLHSIVISFCH